MLSHTLYGCQRTRRRALTMYVSRMDKLIFLMRRKESTTRDSFFHHYLEVHSLLGLSLVPTLDGYTVNITDVIEPPLDDIHHPDAVVEMWTRDIEVFMDMNRTFAKPGSTDQSRREADFSDL